MDAKTILHHVDHTLLKATASWSEIDTLCQEAIQYQTASVCVPSTYVKRIQEKFGNALTICTVIGFPLGNCNTAAKEAEIKQALADGAKEFDMVINLGDVKNGDFEKVTAEIATLKVAIGTHILKVIVETCYLTTEEKIALCQCVSMGKADFIKTSTGFGSAGAQLEDIALFKKHITPSVKIKAAGAIRTREQMVAFLESGCSRIGASSAVRILRSELI